MRPTGPPVLPGSAGATRLSVHETRDAPDRFGFRAGLTESKCAAGSSIAAYCEVHARAEARRLGIELPVDVAKLVQGPYSKSA